MLLRALWLALIVFCLILQIIIMQYFGIISYFSLNVGSDEWSNFKRTKYLFENLTTAQGIPDTCSLANYSSWDPRIMNYSDVYYDRKVNLCKKPEEWSYLEKQVLKSRHGYRCKGRCVNYNGGIKFDKWMPQGTKFNCEYVHTICWEYKGILYDDIPLNRKRGNIHFQLIEKPVPPRAPSPKRYNIYVLLIDSAAFHQTRRNMPKMMYFLDRELQAVEYGYLNKLGINSYPNMVPIWYGKTVTDIEKQMLMGQKKTPADWNSACNDTKKTPHIIAEAKKYGYQTFLSEYFMYATLKDGFYSSCVKYTMHFKADHDAVPLSNYYVYKKIQPATECERSKKGLSEELKYFSEFIKSYKDTPKFGWLYLIEGSHWFENESALEDTDIYDFLIRHKEELSNSFVIVMADHGLRFGSKMDIPLGEYDNRNPVLAISIPKELRGERLMDNLRQNSKQLQTHYDTRATLLDIMKYQPEVNFTAWQMETFNGEKGNSYLRSQPPGPRTCHTLPIPFQFCICQYKMEHVDSNSHLGKTLAKYVLEEVNSRIIEAKHTSKCGMWQLKEAEIEGYYPIRESGTFQILLNVRQDGLETGKIRATVRIDNGGKPMMTSVARVDEITEAAFCADRHIREFCYCYKMAMFRKDLSDFYSSLTF